MAEERIKILGGEVPAKRETKAKVAPSASTGKFPRRAKRRYASQADSRATLDMMLGQMADQAIRDGNQPSPLLRQLDAMHQSATRGPVSSLCGTPTLTGSPVVAW